MDKFIPVNEPDIPNLSRQYINEALDTGWISSAGKFLEQFEKEFAKYIGTKYAVAVTSGTAALHLALLALKIGPGDEVIVPAFTMGATWLTVIYVGAKPVFVDCEPETYNIDPQLIEAKITKRTKAIVPVDYAGRPDALSEFHTLAKKRRLVFIEDAAQALGATYRGRPVGTQADMTMFSFHPVKSITTGEGGVIVTDNEDYARAMRLFRSHGISKDATTFARKNHGAWYQEMQALGFNYRMPEMSAALGESQLKRLDTFITKRRAAAKRYDKLFKNVPGLILPPPERIHEKSAWHLYPVRLAPRIAHKRDEVFAKLREAGIGVQVHHVPVHLHVFYEKLGYKKGLCPNAEAFVASEISIPLFPNITLKQQQFIANTLKRILAPT